MSGHKRSASKRRSPEPPAKNRHSSLNQRSVSPSKHHPHEPRPAHCLNDMAVRQHRSLSPARHSHETRQPHCLNDLAVKQHRTPSPAASGHSHKHQAQSHVKHDEKQPHCLNDLAVRKHTSPSPAPAGPSHRHPHQVHQKDMGASEMLQHSLSPGFKTNQLSYDTSYMTSNGSDAASIFSNTSPDRSSGQLSFHSDCSTDTPYSPPVFHNHNDSPVKPKIRRLKTPDPSVKYHNHNDPVPGKSSHSPVRGKTPDHSSRNGHDSPSHRKGNHKH